MVYGISFPLLLLGLIAGILQRLYSVVPPRELKRLAAQGDPLAQRIYRPVAFGVSLRLFLWIVAGLGFVGGLLPLIRSGSLIVALITLPVIVAALLVWLPSAALTGRSARLAVWCAPALVWALQHLDQPLQVLARVINRYRNHPVHTRLYEKADLHDLLERQKGQEDNRIAADELERAQQALHFGDRYAADIAQPRKKFRAIEAHDSLGPVLLDELHASKQVNFLVFDGTFDNLVGVVALSDALKARQGGQISGAMRPSITYVHESFTLPEVLSALTTTGQQLAVVLNSSEEVVGVITLQQLTSELAGKLPEQPLAYDDRAGVAASRPTFAPNTLETEATTEEEVVSGDPTDEDDFQEELAGD